MPTIADVFIVESLKFYDEEKNRFEGKFLSHILHLGGKKPKYYYIRTKQELKKVLRLFKKSGYRYLHLSCHGNGTSISTTLDSITFPELRRLVKPYLRRRRLFMSACLAVNHDLANAVIPSSQCYSIVGPVSEIDFDDAAIIWASFYHLIFKEDKFRMGREDITATLQKVVNTFGISLNYFSISKQHGYKGDRIIPGKKRVRTYPKAKVKIREPHLIQNGI